MAIAMMWSESLWAFPESRAADDSWSEHLSSDGPAQEVHLDNANGYAAIFPCEMQGLSTSSGSNVSTISHDKMQLTHLFMLYKY